MKKILLLMLGAMVALASCQKDADLAMGGDDGMVDVTISAAMEGASATTRAIETYGTGATVDRCIMEVYCDNVLYKRMVSSEISNVSDTDGTRSVTFELRLVASSTKKYDFLFWADKDKDDTSNTDTESYYGDTAADGDGDKHYTTTDGLKAVTAIYTNYAGNDETRDAFFGNLTGQTITSSIVLPVTLTRPFGQLNVLTYLEDVPSEMYPEYVQITSSTDLADTFNVYSGETSISATASENTFSWTEKLTSIYYADNDTEYNGTTAMHLSTDYIFAPYYDTDGTEIKQQLVDFKMEFFNDSSVSINTNDNFKNIPIQRNYRTNVSGELLTKQGTISVTIDPVFEYDSNNGDSDINVGVYEIASADDIAAILSNTTEEAVYIKIATKLTGNGYVNIDNVSNTVEEITIEYTEVDSGAVLYFGANFDANTTPNKDTNDSSYTGTLNIVTGSTQFDYIYVYMSSAHVTFSGSVKGATAYTSPDTFVVSSGSSVGTLTVESGNVEVYGTVGGDDTDGNSGDGIIISATNTTTTSIEVYDGGTVDGVSAANNTTLSQEISITVYEGGEVTDVDDDFTIATHTTASAYDDLLTALDGSYTDITIAGDIDLESNTLSIDRAVTIKGAGFSISGGIFTVDSSDVVIEDLTIKGMSGYAVTVSADASLSATNLTTSGNTLGGVYLSASSSSFTLVSGSIGDTPQIVLADSSASVSTPSGETWYTGYYNFGTEDDEDVVYIYSQTEFSDHYAMAGSGTEADPYIITMAEHLIYMSELESYARGYYRLEKDIDMAGVTYSPMVLAFANLDGNYHKISNYSGSGLGFIKYMYNSTIKNLTMEDVNSTYSGLVYAVYQSTNIIDNCHVTSSAGGTRSKITQTSDSYTCGGIVARCYGSSTSTTDISLTISNCTVDADITGISSIGGIFGYTLSTSYCNIDIAIKNCTMSGSITLKDSMGTGFGGMVGQGGNTVAITDCVNNAAITGSTNLAGIINNATNATITNCINNGNVSMVSSSTSTSVAGIATAASSATITSCTNNGDVYGYRIVGGIATYATAGTITDCKNTGELTATNQVRTSGTAWDPCCGGIVAFVSISGTYPTITGCASNGDISIPNATEVKANVYVGVYVGCQATYGVDISTVLESDYLSENTSDCTITYSDTTVTYN